MAKKKPTAEIEEAVIVEETASVSIITAEFTAPVLTPYINKDESLKKIQEVKDKYYSVEIADTKDKENYDKVATGMKEFKETRIDYVKAATERLLDPVKTWLAGEKEALDAIVADLKEGEQTLRNKKDAIDQKKKDEKAAAEKLKLERMAGRIQSIVSFGGKDSGAKYVFDHDLTLSVSINEIKDLEEEKWAEKLAEVLSAWDAEQKRIADEKEAQEKAANEAKELLNSNLAKRTQLRLKELKLEDFNLEEGTWFKAGVPYVNQWDIENISEEDWDDMISRSNEAQPSAAPEEKTEDEDDSLPFDDEELPFTEEEDEELPFDDMALSLAQDQEFNDGVAPGTYTTAAEEKEELVETVVNLVFTLETPFYEIVITPKLSHILFAPEMRDIALEGLDVQREEQVTESLYVALIKR